MTIGGALRNGIRTLSASRRIVFLFYAATTAAALLATAPFLAIAFQSLGQSAWAHDMAANLDLSWLSELYAGSGALPWVPVFTVMAVAAAIYLIVYLFLLGGALQVFCTGESFFAGCGRNFWRLVRLTIVSILFYVAVLIVSGRLAALGRAIWGQGSVETPLVYWNWGRAALILVLLGFVNMVFDYARVILVTDDRRNAFRVAIDAFRFVFRNLGRTAGLYIVVSAIAILFFAAYLAVSSPVTQTSMGMVLLLLLIRQAMVLAKIWSRLLYASTAAAMYSALKPPPPPPPVLEPEPEAIVEQAPDVHAAEVTLSPELGINAFEFVTAWNQTPECRAAAEAGLSNISGAEGVVFDPSRLLGSTAVLGRLAQDLDDSQIENLIRQALDSHGPLAIHREQLGDGPRRFTIATPDVQETI